MDTEYNPVAATEKSPSQEKSSTSEYVKVDRIKLKNEMSYEALVAQLQKGTKKVLCVDDGVYLRIFEETGPFPLDIEFEHKQRRYGETEYFFRYAKDTENERSLCVFGRDNAEIFSPDYVDDQDTESESSSEQEQEQEREESVEELFSSSDEESSDLSLRDEVQNLLSENTSKHQISPSRSYKNPDKENEKEKSSSDEVLTKHESLSPKVQVLEIVTSPIPEKELQQKTYDLS